MLDFWTSVLYTNYMSKIKITPVIYEAVKRQYQEALEARREDIANQFKRGKSKQEIADYWNVDVKIVSRIIDKLEKGQS